MKKAVFWDSHIHGAKSQKTAFFIVEQFKETENVTKQKSSGRPRTSEDNVERIKQTCVRRPTKSIARRCLELGIPKTTIQIRMRSLDIFQLT
jgi:hypothetical protein